MNDTQRSADLFYLRSRIESSTDSPKRAKRKIGILEAARKVLAEEGYAKFTLRRVAAESGMHLKSLQRYFPTKRALLTSALEYTLHTYYEEQYSKIFKQKHITSPRDQLLVVIDYLLKDLRSTFTTRFFPELWALASHDEDASAALDSGYTLHRAGFARLILAMNPSLSQKSVAHRAVIIAMLLEGLMLVIGDNKPHHEEFEDLDEEVKKRILDIVMAP